MNAALPPSRSILACLLAAGLAFAAGCSNQPTDDDDSSATPSETPVVDPTASPNLDSDGDGVLDSVDNCVYVVNVAQGDDDGDGIGDACDDDDDGDGVDDDIDNCPRDVNPNQEDTDADGLGDVCDALVDTDRDGIADNLDNCPLYPNEDQDDLDSDGTGDVCDTDDDGDGVSDSDDNCPRTANSDQTDSDQDGVGNACDTGADSDGDGVSDGEDNCPLTPNSDQADTDEDGVGDQCDGGSEGGLSDRDGDGIEDVLDNCPTTANSDQADIDADGVGDACDTGADTDGDGVEDLADNCPLVDNPDQGDADLDGLGDACEASSDSDGDGTADADDNCPNTAGPQTDTDGDGFGDPCDADDDGDGVDDNIDNCPLVDNPSQLDNDSDGVGNGCETVADTDGDGTEDLADNCPLDPNVDQADADSDGLGDACDPAFTGVVGTDTFPGAPAASNYIANDGLAFNPAGWQGTANKGINTYWNGETGTAIVLWLDRGERLWASYYNGSTFGQGVELRADVQNDSWNETDDDMTTFQDANVLFLNTDASGDANTQARDGDAIILWSRYDTTPDPSLGLDSDANVRLYGAYFDVSVADVPRSGEDSDVVYGFQTRATTLDYDSFTGEGNDGNVLSHGFASDSLHGTHWFWERPDSSSSKHQNRYTYLSDPAISGDPTSYVWFVWYKLDTDDSEGVYDRNLHALPFDLTQDGNEMPSEEEYGDGLVPVPEEFDYFGGDNNSYDFLVHNGDVVWFAYDDNSGNRTVITRLGDSEPSSYDLGPEGYWENHPEPGQVYGADHGLDSTYVIEEAEFEQDEGYGIRIAQLHTDGTLETQEITSPSFNTIQGTRIGRTGEFIGIVWSDDGFLVGRNVPIPYEGSDLYVAAVETDRAGAGERALNLEVTEPVQMPNVVPFSYIDYFTFQKEIADGSMDNRRNVQSNPYRINFAFQMYDSPEGGQEIPQRLAEGDDESVALLHNGIVFTPSDGEDGPEVEAAVDDAYPSGVLDWASYNYEFPYSNDDNPHQYSTNSWDGNMRPLVTDLGDADGSPLVFYLRNANNPTDSSAEGAFNEWRVYAADGTDEPSVMLVSTSGPGDEHTITGYNDGENDDWGYEDGGEFLRVQSAPINMDIETNPGWGGNSVHIFMPEAVSGYGSFPGIVTRRLDKTALATADGVGAAFDPVVGEEPVNIYGGHDHAWISPANKFWDDLIVGPHTAFSTSAGDSVGVYFTGNNHMLYQEFDGTSWQADDAGAHPSVVDSDGDGGLFPGMDQSAYAFPPTLIDDPNTFNGTLCFYAKSLAGDDFSRRRYRVRVHD